MALTVKDAMQVGAFQECKLLGGAGGLYKSVNYISSMEIPTVRGWVSPRQMVITTAYSIKNEPHKVIEILKDLHMADASGLCLKTRFIGEISTEVVELADQLNMPLIEIPDYIPFVNIIAPLMKEIISEQNIQLMESNFFIDLIAKNVKSEEEARIRANNLKWPKLPVTIVIFDVDAFEEAIKEKMEYEIFQLKEAIYQIIRQQIFTSCGQAAIVKKSDSFSCIFADTVPQEQILNTVQQVQVLTKKRLGLSLTAGACRHVVNYTELEKAEADARDAIMINRKGHLELPLLFIDEAKLEQVLLELRHSRLMIEYIDDTLGRLEKFDAANNTQLLNTLEELAKFMGMRVKAAKALFLHRNTLAQRIKKIEGIIGCSLDSERQLLSLAIASKVKKFLQ